MRCCELPLGLGKRRADRESRDGWSPSCRGRGSRIQCRPVGTRSSAGSSRSTLYARPPEYPVEKGRLIAVRRRSCARNANDSARHSIDAAFLPRCTIEPAPRRFSNTTTAPSPASTTSRFPDSRRATASIAPRPGAARSAAAPEGLGGGRRQPRFRSQLLCDLVRVLALDQDAARLASARRAD